MSAKLVVANHSNTVTRADDNSKVSPETSEISDTKDTKDTKDTRDTGDLETPVLAPI